MRECKKCKVFIDGDWTKCPRCDGETEDFEMRFEVKWFSLNMERVLRENDHKGGWDHCTFAYLKVKLLEEVQELFDALENNGDAGGEAVDVANFAMMIATNWRRNLTKD